MKQMEKFVALLEEMSVEYDVEESDTLLGKTRIGVTIYGHWADNYGNDIATLLFNKETGEYIS